jgi:hypothetical protein
MTGHTISGRFAADIAMSNIASAIVQAEERKLALVRVLVNPHTFRALGQHHRGEATRVDGGLLVRIGLVSDEPVLVQADERVTSVLEAGMEFTKA